MAMIFALSAFSVIGYAEGETTEIYEPKAEKWFVDLNETRELHIRMRGESGNSDMYFKGDSVVLTLRINDFVSAVMVQSPEGEYLYFSHFPFFYMDFDEYFVGPSWYEMGFGISDLEFVRSYSSGNYLVEEYIDPDTNEITSYWLINGEVKYIESPGKRLEIVSTQVSEKEVSLPWYAIESKMMVMLIAMFFGRSL